MSQMPRVKNLSRRNFLRASACATAAAALSGPRLLAQERPGSDLRLAVIGLNGRGGSHLEGFWDQVVAVCDVDQTILDRCQRQMANADSPKRVEAISDFRRLLDRDDIDAVTIATPNHLHSWIGILAAQAGKDVYVEKPVSQTVWEGRQLVNAARRYGRVIQCGTQSRSSRALQEAQKYAQSGELGRPQYAVATCYKPRPSIGKLDQPLKIPESIDYDLWCGPAAKVDLYRPHLHYDWHWDFNTGNGDLGNQGIHQMDIARWMLGIQGFPRRVVSYGGRLGYEDAGNTPNTLVVHLDYDPAPILFEVRGLPSKSGSEEMDEYRGSRVGVVVQFEKGHLLIPSYGDAVAYDTQGQEIKSWHEGNDQLHFDNFLAAVRARDAGLLNAEVLEGHLSSALCHLGNTSYRMGQAVGAPELVASVQGNDLLADSVDRMLTHGEANGLPRDSVRVVQGAELTMEPGQERFRDETANAMLHRIDRSDYRVPEVTV